MRIDPDEIAWESYLADNYVNSNYGKSIAGWLMRWGHAALEHDFPPQLRFERVLEVGAGEGVHLLFVRHAYGEYVLTDNNLEALERIRPRLPLRVSVMQQDARHLDFKDGHFDRVVATHVLEHIPDPRSALREWSRVLKPGGILSLVLPCDPGIAWRLGRCFGPRKKACAAGIDYDYWMAREHVNSIHNLIAFVRFYFESMSGVTQNQPRRVRVSSKPATLRGIDLRVARRMPHNGADEPTQSASSRTDYSAEDAGLVLSADRPGTGR